MQLFYENSWQLKAVNYRKSVPSWMLYKVLNTPMVMKQLVYECKTLSQPVEEFAF